MPVSIILEGLLHALRSAPEAGVFVFFVGANFLDFPCLDPLGVIVSLCFKANLGLLSLGPTDMSDLENLS